MRWNNRSASWFHAIEARCAHRVATVETGRLLIGFTEPDRAVWGNALQSSGKGPDTLAAKGKVGKARVHSKDRDMGAALRTVYQKTVEEAVPDDLMALLGKLD